MQTYYIHPQKVKLLEDPWIEPPEYIYTRTKNLIETPNDPDDFGY